ncbi:YceI family protein [Mycobacterium sp. PS03-16]|uniref:YceI family protein n=1 Tax=Mycobacterium sp. PS03-16 TaxID=2559611 RepID=UPI001072F35E|nr:YceI family protein [Mycobacterium sp. PS03-16]TFV61453.1 YceI family protein [Mycobacterium sp. PS03-16]
MTWTLDAADGDLHILTDVAGPAARMGHRLTILVASWSASVEWAGEHPGAVTLVADIGSPSVESGEGGVTPLSGPERALARSNARKSLSAQQFPTVSFESSTVTPSDRGYRLTGELHIHGRRREHSVDVQVDERGDTWHMSTRSTVRQSDFGVKPYSMLMGSMRVADPVTVTFSATRAKD